MTKSTDVRMALVVQPDDDEKGMLLMLVLRDDGSASGALSRSTNAFSDVGVKAVPVEGKTFPLSGELAERLAVEVTERVGAPVMLAMAMAGLAHTAAENAAKAGE